MEAILRVLNIYPEEKKVTGTLLALAFAIGIGRVFALTAGFSIFLEVWSAADLAYVYMLTSVGTMAASAGYLRLGRKLSPRLLITANLVIVAAMTLVLWALIAFGIIVLAVGFDRPLTLLILSATLNGFVMFLYTGLLLWLNISCLRGPLRPSPLRIAALLGAVAFFGYFSVLTLLDQLSRVG